MNVKIKKMRIPIELKQLLKNQADHGKSVVNEYSHYIGDPLIEGISCAPESNEDDYSNLLARVPGPAGSPYEGGVFQIKISFGTQYPFQPPTFKFSTPIYHPNIDNCEFIDIFDLNITYFI